MRKFFGLLFGLLIIFTSFEEVLAERIPRCVRGDPLLVIWFYSTPIDQGNSGSVMTKIGNGDRGNCFPSEFELSVNFPNRWRPRSNPHGTITLPVDGRMVAETYQQIDFTVPEYTPNRVFDFVVSLKNKNSGRVTSQNISIDVGNEPRILTIDPAVGPVGTVVTLTGENFGPLPELAVQHAQGYLRLGNIPSDGSSYTFTMPGFIKSYACAGCVRPSPLGVYTISLGNNGAYSNIVNFSLIP